MLMTPPFDWERTDFWTSLMVDGCLEAQIWALLGFLRAGWGRWLRGRLLCILLRHPELDSSAYAPPKQA